jgi:hypothetical protein
MVLGQTQVDVVDRQRSFPATSETTTLPPAQDGAPVTTRMLPSIARGAALAALGVAAVTTAAVHTATAAAPPRAAVQLVVPAGVHTMVVDMAGSSSGNGVLCTVVGGYGGRTIATVPVTPGETLEYNVASSFAGAGPNGNSSDLRRAPYGLADRIVVAGGGGWNVEHAAIDVVSGNCTGQCSGPGIGGDGGAPAGRAGNGLASGCPYPGGHGGGATQDAGGAGGAVCSFGGSGTSGGFGSFGSPGGSGRRLDGRRVRCGRKAQGHGQAQSRREREALHHDTTAVASTSELKAPRAAGELSQGAVHPVPGGGIDIRRVRHEIDTRSTRLRARHHLWFSGGQPGRLSPALAAVAATSSATAPGWSSWR